MAVNGDDKAAIEIIPNHLQDTYGRISQSKQLTAQQQDMPKDIASNSVINADFYVISND